MPIRIREVHFKATVRDRESNRTSTDQTRQAPSARDTQALVATCVEEVLQKIREKNER